MDDCLFCKIIKREIPSEIIYEDDDFLVFLDIKPATNGDSLIVPKKHFLDITELDEELLLKMQKLITKLYTIYQEKLNCIGLTLTTNKDYAQEIKHLHIHFIPRYCDDKVGYLSNKEILKDLKEIKDQLTN